MGWRPTRTEQEALTWFSDFLRDEAREQEKELVPTSESQRLEFQRTIAPDAAAA
ncbi:hypothetical protein [Duganella violaceipulchra]|uniref:Uncharacterized protein n=1 Tax=Duganella violaceipulchra TaxID=2849652 RepID=A0AA41HBL2_9BURK|nr:hypothetical protein [Duganella violaceicalia]MBV6325503.1 hypothetical protein [Duganella violaceicalia]MCP2012675.1 hypothetical protein [Duganella violaceicalia]